MSEHASGVSKKSSAPAAARQIQRKVAVSRPDDAHEKEADKAAEHVLAGTPAPMLSRVSATAPSGPAAQRESKAKEDPKPVQKKGDEAKKPEAVQRATEPKKPEAVQRAADPKKPEPVQRATDPKKPEPVQRATDPKKTESAVQRQVNDRKSDKKEEPVQRKAETAAPSASLGDVAQSAIDSKGPGRPLESSVRQPIERSLGADLGSTRVHDDSAARSSAAALDARAFTHGSDIWLGPGESSSNLGLMAHEAAHVVQQGSAAQRLVQRNGPSGTGTPPSTGTSAVPPPDPATLPLETGRPDPATSTIAFDELPIPQFKKSAHRGELYTSRGMLVRKQNYERGNPNQREVWREGLNKSNIQTILGDRIRTQTGATSVNPTASYVLEVPAGERGRVRTFLIGDLPTLARQLTIPTWGRAARNPALSFYDVDHIVELQVANWSDDGWANTLPNMELLDSEINQESGRVIRENIEEKVNAFLRVTGTRFGTSVENVKQRYKLTFARSVGRGRGARAAGDDKHWKRSEIEAGDHLRPVQVVNAAALDSDRKVRLFPTPAGGIPRMFTWPGDEVTEREADWLSPFVITRKTFSTDAGSEGTASFGTLWIQVRAGEQNWRRWPADKLIPVKRLAGARYAGFIEKASVLDHMYELRHKKASPIRVDNFEVLPDVGVYIQGVILPELPILRDAHINFEVRGNRLQLYKEFEAGTLSVPRPFSIKSATLRVFADTERGLGAEGRVNFGIERVGEGYVQAEISTSGPMGFSGAFDFDSSTFDPARIELSYLDGVFRGRGAIGIPDGKVAGVKRAHLEINVEGTSVSGTGTLEPKIRAIREGRVTFAHSESAGTMIGGALELSDDIPNVQSGSIQATLTKPPGQEAWDLRAQGTVTAGVPGFTATVNADYHNGLFTVEGSGAFSRGLLSGTVSVGATNRAIGADGRPTDTPGERVIAYGGGTVTVRIAPWLQGSVGVRFLPNGEMELTGSVALPDVLEIFPEKTLNRNIFSINLDIPIIGFAVAGQRVGIFATIGGGLDLSAGIGPGQLRELGLSVTYNPAHEDQTRVHGGAKLVIPAHAGLRLFIRGALGAGIPIVSASLGLEVGAQLGLEGAAEASVSVNWSPSTGLSLDALGEIYVQPKFRFDLTGFLLVEADLLFTSIELYQKRWNLAAFELGPDLRFGVRFPFHYREGEPFDISWDQVEFQVPDVNTDALLGDIVDKII